MQQQQASTGPRHAVATQLTIANDAEEIMPKTEYGPVDYISWCEKEAARISRRGRSAFVRFNPESNIASVFIIRN
jgi:hypothetical protein